MSYYAMKIRKIKEPTDLDGLGKYVSSSEHIILLDELHKLVCKLKGRQKQIINMYLQGLSFEKIANEIQLTKSTVEVYYFRAIKRLKILI